MLEQVLATMENIHKVTSNPMSKSSIRMLQCLLRIEEDAAEGGRYSAQCLKSQVAANLATKRSMKGHGKAA